MTTLTVIRPRPEDVEGQPILRPLPSRECRSVGPFVFFDHMLPTHYAPGSGMNIRQHPHIGLSTLTYLFEGALQHKDSLGSDQDGSGRRCQLDDRRQRDCPRRAHARSTQGQGFSLHGLQVWLASPKDHETGPGHYSHHPAASLPTSDNLGVQIRLIAGNGFCLKSPVPVLSPTLYADVQMQTATTLLIPDEHEERAVYVLEGDVQLDGEPLEAHSLVVLPSRQAMTLSADSDCHLVVFGGAPLDGPRRINWNFVASDPAVIEQARQRWAAGDRPTVPGETERIELPVR